MSFIIRELKKINCNILKTNKAVRQHLTAISKESTRQVSSKDKRYHRNRYNHIAQVIGAYVTADIFGGANYLSIQGEIPLSLRKKRSRGRMCSADFIDYSQKYASEIKRFGKNTSKKKIKEQLEHAVLQLNETALQTSIDQKIIVVFARDVPCVPLTKWVQENIIENDTDIIWLYDEEYAVHDVVTRNFHLTLD